MDSIKNLITEFCCCETYIDNNIDNLTDDNTHNNSDNKYYLYDSKTNEFNIKNKKILIIDNFI